MQPHGWSDHIALHFLRFFSILRRTLALANVNQWWSHIVTRRQNFPLSPLSWWPIDDDNTIPSHCQCAAAAHPAIRKSCRIDAMGCYGRMGRVLTMISSMTLIGESRRRTEPHWCFASRLFSPKRVFCYVEAALRLLLEYCKSVRRKVCAQVTGFSDLLLR